MGTALQLYGLLYLTIKGRLMTETANMSIGRNLNASDVATLAKGFAGVSPGAGTTDIQISNAVPSRGFEFEPGDLMQRYIPAEVGVLGPGGTQMSVDCFILSDSISTAVNSPTMLDMTLRGPFAEWK